MGSNVDTTRIANGIRFAAGENVLRYRTQDIVETNTTANGLRFAAEENAFQVLC